VSAEDILERPAPPADARIAYGPDDQQFGDLRLPAGPGPYPVVVAIHGGYWRARYGLEYFGHVCAALAQSGVATWNIEYRRLGNPVGGWPGTFADVAQAVDYLRALAPRHALDLARVVALGHSAGGHLALWAAARHRLPGDHPLRGAAPLPLAGVVALAGVCDLRQAWALRLSDGVVRPFLGGAPDDVPDRYAAASPAELLPLGVPQALVHGTADPNVPYVVSRDYAARASAAGDAATLITLSGAGHFEMVDPETPEWRTALGATLRLLGTPSA
jgi:acetyl esterase/lipase